MVEADVDWEKIDEGFSRSGMYHTAEALKRYANDPDGARAEFAAKTAPVDMTPVPLATPRTAKERALDKHGTKMKIKVATRSESLTGPDGKTVEAYEYTEQEALVRDQLGIHSNSRGDWSITHLTTGLAAVQRIKTQKQAVAVRDALVESSIDFDFGKGDPVPDSLAGDVTRVKQEAIARLDEERKQKAAARKNS